MEILQGLSFLMLMGAAVFLARMIRQYRDGLKQAGALVMKLPRKAVNGDVIGALLLLAMGLNDLRNGELVFGVVITAVGLWWGARGLLPYQFHEQGLMLQLEYFGWDELKSWSWAADGKSDATLNFAGKPSRHVRSTSGKDELDQLFRDKTHRL